MKRLIASLVMVVVLALLVVLPAAAKSKQQVLVSVILRAGTRQAQVSISSVDGSKIRKLSRADFKRGIRIRDDNGQVLKLRGTAALNRAAPSFQVWDLTNTKIGHATGRVVRTVHLFLGVFTGDDFEHWYDSGDTLCTMYTGLQSCVTTWESSLP